MTTKAPREFDDILRDRLKKANQEISKRPTRFRKGQFAAEFKDKVEKAIGQSLPGTTGWDPSPIPPEKDQ